MGIYSTNRHGSMSSVNYADEIAANESYNCESGLGRLLVESQLNDMAVFEAVIKNDMQTVIGLQEGTILESEIASLNEAAGGSFFQRIIDLFKKLIAKIKGIVESFIRKINMLCTRDNKKLVEKYKKIVDGKNYSKFEFKYREANGEITPETVFEKLKAENDKLMGYAKGKVETDDDVEKIKNGIDTALTEHEDDDAFELELLKATLGGEDVDSLKEYSKAAMDAAFKDEDTYSNFESKKASIMNTLIGAKKQIDEMTKTEKKATDRMNEIIKYFEKLKNEKAASVKNATNKADYADNAGYKVGKDASDADKNTATCNLYAANACYKISLIAQSALSKALSAKMAAAKFQIKQDRAVWMKAVQFNPKSVKESANLENIVYESCMAEELFA